MSKLRLYKGEEAKTIPSAKLFSATSYGRVINNINGRTHNGGLDSYGYRKIGIRFNDGVVKVVGIHRLVAEAFLPNPYNKPFVNHKDGDKANNTLDNLEWVTHDENMRHSRMMSGGINYKTFKQKILLSQRDIECLYAWYQAMPLPIIATAFKLHPATIKALLFYCHPDFGRGRGDIIRFDDI